MLCAYPTVKYVQIQDSRLVCLRYTLLLGICFYVGFFEMFALGGWLEASPVVGVVRFSLQQPTVDNCDPVLEGCDNAFSPVDTMPYCEQYHHHNHHHHHNDTSSYKGKVYPCEIYEAASAQMINEKSLTVMTRASTIEQEFVCPVSTSKTCPKTYNNTEPEYKFYVHQSESFTVLVDHAVTASKICTAHQPQQLTTDDTTVNYACSSESSSYQGRLYSKSLQLCQREALQQNAFSDYRSNTTKDTAPCYINPNRTKASNQDFFSLDVLLQAAGISSLDDCNIKTNGTCQTYRDTGATLLLNVFWSDFVTYRGTVEPHYYYSPQLVGKSSYKQYIPFYHDNYRANRTLLNAHGIRLAVLLGGEFHQFNPVSFLIVLTTALGLLAVATTIVDSLMLYILPEKERYNAVKYENTETFEANDVVSSAVRAGWGAVNNNLLAAVNPGGGGQEGRPSHLEQQEENGSLQDPLLADPK